MDTDKVEFIGKMMLAASAKGYVASFDTTGDRIRMVLRALDGFTIPGLFMETREEAMLSAAEQFKQFGLNHDTSSGAGNS